MAEELGVDSIFKFKVDELKQELAKRGLPKTGAKSDLQERLLQYVTSQIYNKEDETDDKSITDEKESSRKDLGEASDPVEECSSKNEIGTDGDITAEVLSDEVLNNSDETPNEGPEPSNETLDEDEDDDDDDEDDGGGGDGGDNDGGDDDGDDDRDDDVDDHDDDNDEVEEVEEDRAVSQTDFDIESNPVDNVACPEETSITHSKPNSESKFCRVTITSPDITEGKKIENRTKRFGVVLPESEVEKKKSRLGRFSSMGLGQGDEVTEEDIEKIKKRAERFGAVSSILTNPSGDRLQSRLERFADGNMKKRQERFGVTQTKSLEVTSDMDVRKQNRLSKFGAV